MLANQGIDPGSAAYGKEMDTLNRGQNDAYSSAMSGAIQQGTAAGHTAFQDNLAAQNNPYQQMGALGAMSGQSQAPGGAQYLPAAMANYQGALQGYGIQQQGKNSQMAGTSQLGSLLPYLSMLSA